jgi:hypothetical protein
MFRKLKNRIKWILEDLRFLKILFSPFRPFGLKFYFGKIAIGTPYFFPRKWIENKDKPGWKTAVPKKIGFDFLRLGWKTKWTATDFRFEWGPLLSFVCFGYQIAIMVDVRNRDQYWEAWLYYEYATDKTKSKKERIAQCRKEFPQTWKIYHKDPKTGENTTQETIDYYERILKPRYLK